MRLIEARTYRLEKFFDDNIPEYAILSHTWGKEEVLFEDMMHLESRIGFISQKEGFQKIQFLCRTALEQEYSYVWIDTSCIDKSSSSELTEAINSMYRWYAEAKVCYVFLSDVTSTFQLPLPTGAMGSSGSHSYTADEVQTICRSSFGQSRWWSRSWTLQELIAPIAVSFFRSDGIMIATRELLCKPISTITGIDG
jgi:hypothetical protein